ncbi:hypothetical protein CHS0354_008527 [Potamilus streckersoni]|uniref:Syndecan n=1 Tax=Potamilus streckersoni TaxID=2493646 RepID=A0AAE0S7W7_9BIVA|nr:hypothetical protein CHS0354_008527 [Potamilus streckersoni]
MRRSLLFLGVLVLLLNVNCEAKKKPQRFWGRNWDEKEAGTINIDNEDIESSGSHPTVDHTHIDDEDDGDIELIDENQDTGDKIVASGDKKPPLIDDEDKDDDLQGSGSGAEGEQIIASTKSSTTTTTTTVSTTKALTPCQQLRTSSLNLSSYTPQCKENGDFEKLQCRGKNMQRTCWCVNPHGMEISGTMKDKGEPDCDFGTNLKTCVFQLVQNNQGLLGAFKPSCTLDGEYEPIQCHENTCWCVDKLGNEKVGTMTSLPEKPECRETTVIPPTTNKTGTTKTLKKTDYVISTMKPVKETVVVETIKDNNVIPIDSEEVEDPELKEEKTNEINDEESQRSPQTAATAQLLLQPGLLAAVIGSAVVGLLCIILLIMFIIYRMRKKDEGSYPLDDQKYQNYTYSKAPEKEFYA